MPTTVVNVAKKPLGGQFPESTVYIGRRPDGMHFGNPFPFYEGTVAKGPRVATREESVTCFEAWLRGEAFEDVEPERRQWILEHLHELRDQVLGCHCKPLACHGDILAKFADELS